MYNRLSLTLSSLQLVIDQLWKTVKKQWFANVTDAHFIHNRAKLREFSVFILNLSEKGNKSLSQPLILKWNSWRDNRQRRTFCRCRGASTCKKLDLQTISQCLNVNENNDADVKYLVNKTLKDSKAENQCWMCVIVRPSRSTALTADTIVRWKLVHALRNASRNQPPSTHAG